MMRMEYFLNSMEYYLKKAKFVKSITDVKEAPFDYSKEVLFVGKSNVGKSSLINALTNNKKLAYTSSKPGMTRLLNYFSVEDKFYIVDCPGYGFSSKKYVDYEFYGNMVESYFNNNEKLKLIVFLLDSRHLPTDDDIDFYKFLLSYNYRFIICMTKCDKLNMSMKAKINKNLEQTLQYDTAKFKPMLVSINDKKSIMDLKNIILNAIGD